MRNYSRRFVLVLLGSVMIFQGCSETKDNPIEPRSRDQVGLFTIRTEIGPVDVLSFRDEPGGMRSMQIHAVNGDGTHRVRTIKTTRGPSPEFPDGFLTTSAIYDQGGLRSRFTQVHFLDASSGFQQILETGGDRLQIKAKPDGELYRVQYRFEIGDRVREARLILDSNRAGDLAYAQEFSARVLEIYPGGPLVADPDHLLMTAVLGSRDWENYLDEAPYPVLGKDKKTTERIRRFCVIMSATAHVSCLVSILQPALLGVCISSSLMSAGCTLYEINQLTVNDDGAGCPCDCMCPNN